MNYRFTSIITKEKKWYVARCAELGVVSQGKTIEMAQKNLQEALELYLEDYPSTKIKELSRYGAPFVTTLDVQYG